MHQKNTDQKICPVCQRPFSWRKKWAKVWDSVTYCSKGCNHKRNSKMYKLKYE